jgi:hypothetical protein
MSQQSATAENTKPQGSAGNDVYAFDAQCPLYTSGWSRTTPFRLAVGSIIARYENKVFHKLLML